MKKYKVYLEDRNDCYAVYVPANTEKDARKFVEGNGEIIAVKDVSNDFPISLSKVADALANAHFGGAEMDLILRTLTICNIAE